MSGVARGRNVVLVRRVVSSLTRLAGRFGSWVLDEVVTMIVSVAIAGVGGAFVGAVVGIPLALWRGWDALDGAIAVGAMLAVLATSGGDRIRVTTELARYRRRRRRRRERRPSPR